MKVFGFVQAGGASTRFGTDKALVQFGGQTMLARIAELVSSICEHAFIVAPAGKYKYSGRPVLNDRWPGEGPLGGILTALHYVDEILRTGDAVPCAATTAELSPNPLALIVSCDMPFLTREFLTFLRDRSIASPADVIVPRSASGLEPLCACWKYGALTKMQSAFDSGVRKVADAMDSVTTEQLDESAWKRFDRNGRLFWNMNTPQDFEEARLILESQER